MQDEVFEYSKREHRQIVQELRVDVIKYIIGILLFALAVPAVVVVLTLESKIPEVLISKTTVTLIFLSWATIICGIISGSAYLAIAPRWVIWRKHETFLNVTYALCPSFLLLAAGLIALLYLNLLFRIF
ncbi:hypothetical protein [Lentibacter sp.]|uniref:hypothetical protein n=1 Tax=Lentibacter sp. TaxID=2024994 RepID=UPI003F6BC7B9